MSGADFNFAIANRMAELDRLNAELDAFFGRAAIAEDTAFTIRLAVEEIVTNQIKYGFPAGGEHGIALSLRPEDGRWVLAVEDDGAEFDPLKAPEPNLSAPIEGRPIGGLGLHLVKAMTDHVVYTRANGKNILTVYFKKATEGKK